MDPNTRRTMFEMVVMLNNCAARGAITETEANELRRKAASLLEARQSLQKINGAEDWEDMTLKYKQHLDLHDEGPDRSWLAIIPNMIDYVIAAEPEGDKWKITLAERHSLPCLPALPDGLFDSADEAKRAADVWCSKWAPRQVFGCSSLRMLRLRSDGQIGISDDEVGGIDDHVLTIKDARALGSALLAMAAEVEP